MVDGVTSESVLASVMNRNDVLAKAMAGKPSITISDELMYQWIGEDNWMVKRINDLEKRVAVDAMIVDKTAMLAAVLCQYCVEQEDKLPIHPTMVLMHALLDVQIALMVRNKT